MRVAAKDLSEDQRAMYAGVRAWLDRGARTKRTLTCAGFAGTGKSTVVSVLARELPSPLAFCAFTGLGQLGDLYDFGYALTCHKMQGSQAAEVCVLVEPDMRYVMAADEHRRWLYTAVTRAEKRLCVVR